MAENCQDNLGKYRIVRVVATQNTSALEETNNYKLTTEAKFASVRETVI
jgi:hypothetical protein